MTPMKLYLIERTAGVFDRGVSDRFVVRAQNEDHALWFVCGGPNEDPALSNLPGFDRSPQPGFEKNRSNATAMELTEDGHPGIILDG